MSLSAFLSEKNKNRENEDETKKNDSFSNILVRVYGITIYGIRY